MLAALLLAASLGSAPDAVFTTPPVHEVWAGYQVVRGTRHIMILGTVHTQTESFVLAQVTRHPNSIDIEQRACRVDINKVLGVKVRMPRPTLESMPTAHIHFERSSAGQWKATPWVVGWGTEDLDHDGHPGVTVVVDAALCGGKVYVASATTSHAVATLKGGALQGSITVRVQQEVLGASGFCLRMASKDTDETQQGSFAYEKVPASSTCASLARGPWPVRVP